MNHDFLLDSILLLDSYITTARQRQHSGRPIDEALVSEAETMLYRLLVTAAVQAQPLPSKHL